MKERRGENTGDLLAWLEAWARIHGEDESNANPLVRLETISSGWSVTISLTKTKLEDQEFEEVEINRSPDDWIACWVDGGLEARDLEWQGRGGPSNLVELMTVFRSWASNVAPSDPAADA